ncbi:WYL domain-containing protein [Bacillus sp. T33-2]|uniref:WYL domain-containing protein n=1 Tax=Bacillus sp. T33-2 TaxID=2054168 RepID=UPI000C791FEC|nr:WYL domain-containing protein [Bacillus sp. T33-2]PLR97573.1 hypothetical protein CVD19_08830 [Bacillus sp. T33-2]
MNALLRRAIQTRQPLEMIYLSGGNEITQRKVIIKELKGSYAKAFCYLRNENRLFKLDNILSILPIKPPLYKSS